MKKKLLAAVLAALMAMSMTACGSDKEEGGKSEGKKTAKIIDVDLTIDMKKKLLAAVLAALMAMSMTACGSDKEEGGKSEGKKTAKIIDVDLTDEEYAFGVDKKQPELLEQVNTFIAKIKEDGTLDEICEKYFSEGEPTAVKSAKLDTSKDQLVVATNAAFEPFEFTKGGTLDEICEKYFSEGEPTAVKSAKLDTSKDQLVVATNAAFEPFEFTKGDEYYGIDMEIASLLAEELNQELVIQNMDFDAVCLSVGQSKCDVAMAGLTVNEERAEQVAFTDTYYEASQRLIVSSDNTAFDDCKEAADVEKLLNELKESDSIGVQAGTTGQYYIEGDEEWGFPGLPAKCVTYKNSSLAVQDLINGNIDYVMVDAAPAKCITEAITEMQ